MNLLDADNQKSLIDLLLENLDASGLGIEDLRDEINTFMFEVSILKSSLLNAATRTGMYLYKEVIFKQKSLI